MHGLSKNLSKSVHALNSMELPPNNLAAVQCLQVHVLLGCLQAVPPAGQAERRKCCARCNADGGHGPFGALAGMRMVGASIMSTVPVQAPATAVVAAGSASGCGFF